MQRPVYLDHHATTPVDPRVFAAMAPYLQGCFGNASSASHAYGREAAEAVTHARRQVAEAVGAAPDDVVFTSGATESINLAIQGACRAHKGERRQLITVATEHKAVLDTCAGMAALGYRTRVLPVGADGRVALSELREALATPTLLVAAMAVNNEVGTVQPVAAIAEAAHAAGALLFCDGAQALGRTPLQLRAWGVDLCSVTAHKCYGPKGVGALVARPEVALDPLFFGGGQERGLRPGTPAVPMLVALGEAMALAEAEREADEARIGALRDQLWAALQRDVPRVALNGGWAHRVAGNLNVSIACVDAATLMVALPDLAVSAGSACSSGTPKPSHVLRALGLDDEAALSTVRFGLGRGTTEADVRFAARRVAEEVAKIRASSPLWALTEAGVDVQWG